MPAVQISLTGGAGVDQRLVRAMVVFHGMEDSLVVLAFGFGFLPSDMVFVKNFKAVFLFLS